jgi:AmiR/NasT family two-component response regulator
MKVLVAEDETVIRLDLRGLLERAGHEICGQARDGIEVARRGGDRDPRLASRAYSPPGVRTMRHSM